MLILVTYDVSTETKEGQRRLSKVAKKCEANGQRVQNSVFECILDYSQYLTLVADLKKIIKEDEDSIRFYNLGAKYDGKVVHIGIKPSIPLDGNLVI